MGSYAIVKASGRQFWIEENRFYDLNKLPLQAGDTFTLNQILLVKQNNKLELGKPFFRRQVYCGGNSIKTFIRFKNACLQNAP